MSKSLLYHAFNITSCFRLINTKFKNGKIIFSIKRYFDKCSCSNCESKNIKPRGSKDRTFQTIPIGRKVVEIVVTIFRLECTDCGCIRQERIEFVDKRVTYTRAFARYVIELSKYMTIKDIALHLNTSWDIIKDIQKKYLKKKFSKPKLKHIKQIAIDEISIAKGHKYLTIVLDLESGAVIFVGDGKDADSLEPFWKRLRCSGAKIEAVAIDMSPAYKKAVLSNLPNVKLVFDHFHIIKLFNKKLSNLRRKLYRELTDIYQKEVLKGIRWLLLKNPDNLDEKKNEKERLEKALEINKPLAIAYYLKEELRQLWAQENKVKAEEFLDDWIKLAHASKIPILTRFANTMAAHKSGILAWYDYKISTGPLEGTNNKIKTMKRQAYGFRDHEFLKLKIYAIHRTKYALVG